MKYVTKPYTALLLKGILFLFLIASFTPKSEAGIEPVLRNLLQDTSLRVDSSITVEDIQFNLNNLEGFELVKAKNRISLGLNHDNLLYCMNDSFQCEVTTAIKWWDKDGNITLDTVSLTVSYTIEKGVKYQEINTHYFEGAYKIDAKILSICDTFLAPFLIFSVEVEIERYKEIDASISPTFNAHSLNSDNELELSWSVQDGAEEYELEWLIVDDYDGEGGYLDASEIEYDFRHNSARVVLSVNSYKISAVHEHGYLLFRVRAVGLAGSNFTHRVNGRWSSDGYTNTVDKFDLSKDAYQVSTLEHEPNLNWQYVASFAEEGKKKEIVSYYDGSLRNRQSVTRVNSDENTIVSENMYDHQGRMAIQVLPVPSFENVLKYYTNFTRFEDGVLYDKSRFDTGKCEVNSPPMNDSSGASLYYSASNLDLNGPNAHLASFIPDAEGYPFSRTLYMDDNTGRIKAQGGVGSAHQLGSGHETKYFYATPFQEELDRLFGNSVGYKEHYQKNMVVDPNGQVSVSYLDLSGRVIATSLAGETPENVVQLDNKTDSVELTVNLLASSDSLLSKKSLSFSKAINVAKNSWHYFDYSVNPASYQDDCLDSGMCMDCVYDLVISLKDDCGVELLDGDKNTAGIQTLVRTIGTPLEFLNTDCDTGLLYHFGQDSLLEEEVKAYLTVGSYTLTKTLKVNNKALDYYTDEFVKNTNCVKTLADFENDFIAAIDYSGCELSCDSCIINLGTEPDFVTRIMAELTEEGLIPTSMDSTRAIDMYNEQLERCEFLCTEESSCSVYASILEMDIEEGGQYEDLTSITQHPEYCIYEACITNEACKLYDQKMQKVATLKEALALGYLDPLNYKPEYPDGEEDECITDVPANETALKAKLDAYTDIGGTDITLWDFVVLAFHCNDENATNSELLSCISNYTLDTTSCGLQGDMMWNLFKSAYVAEKNKILETGICVPTIAEGKERRLFTMQNVNDLSGGGTAMEQQDRMQDSLDLNFTENCNSYANFWMQKLVNCNLSELDSIAVRNALIGVCIDGSDNEHPMGSSTVAPAKMGTATYKSFKEVLVDKGVFVAGLCDDLLIEFPAPYGSDLNSSITVDSTCTDNSCEAGLSQKLKEALRMAQFPAKCEKCIDCLDIKRGIDSLNVYFEDSVFFDHKNRNWAILIEKFLNRELEVNFLYQDYIELLQKCTNSEDGDSILFERINDMVFIGGVSHSIGDDRGNSFIVHSVINTFDGNKVVLSESRYTGYNSRINLTKTNDNGAIIWSKDYTSSYISNEFKEEFIDIKETIDSGLVFIVNPTWNYKQTYSSLVVKTDKSGVVQWQKAMRAGAYMNDRSSHLRTILILDSGDILLSGDIYIDSCNMWSPPIPPVFRHISGSFSVKLDNTNGNTLDSNWITLPWIDGGYSGVNDMYKMASNNVIQIGTLYDGGVSSSHSGSSYLLKTNPNGSFITSKNINARTLASLTVSNSGESEFVTVGSFKNGSNVGIELVKFDSSLNIVWTKLFGVPSYGGVFKLTPNKIIKEESGYIISYVHDLSANRKTGLLKIDEDGELIWSRRYCIEDGAYVTNHFGLRDNIILSSDNSILLFSEDFRGMVITPINEDNGYAPSVSEQELDVLDTGFTNTGTLHSTSGYGCFITAYNLSNNWVTANLNTTSRPLHNTPFLKILCF